MLARIVALGLGLGVAERSEAQGQEEENARLNERNAALEAEVNDLREGLRAIEERARSELGMIVRGETNNGAWFKRRHMWVQNEDTGGSLPDHVERRTFVDDFRRQVSAR